MISQSQDILSRALQWLNEGHSFVLFTVVNTWGSSPRPPGSMMALRDDGHVIGSVSGGCIEYDLIDRLKKEGVPKQPGMISYGVNADEARRFGLPCGGTIRLVQEPFTTANAAASLKKLLEMLEQRQVVTRTLFFDTAIVTLHPAESQDILRCDENRFVHVFGARYRLLIIGAGQVGELLAQIALSLEFAVTVCDPRVEYSSVWTLENTTLTGGMPDDTVLAMKIDTRTAVVALTHDPKLDDMALIEALASPAFYVGALGSRRNNDARRQRLLAFDLDESQIARLHGPAGLEIGSHTPAEIAVSIAAEIIAVKNNRV